ncbi:MAG: sigma-70 family RNA polymerase sigma factor [Ignavibacteriaceae bacterium]|nr:sigma-70 family RNA polymerase sigma factor [Ignavibacteriaceae bacterium]
MLEEINQVKRIKNGDRNAFKELYKNNVSPLFMFMKQFSIDNSKVEDWVQRAFIKAYENINQFDGISLFKTWLFKIAINEMKMDFRKANSIKNISVDEVEIASEMEDSDLQWELVMKDWLMELSEAKRMVFILYEIEVYSHAEISEMLNIKESASRTILTRTKVWLRNKWNESEK